MILPPRRSVTRFFIPLIDVLILLFAIFILMPFVSEPSSSENADTRVESKEELPKDVKDLQRELSEARTRIDRMQKSMQARLADRLSVRVLQIDRQSGTLFYFKSDSPDRQDIRTAQDALNFIKAQKDIASKSGGGVKDVFFLVLFPPRSSYPTQEQVNEIRLWFKDELIGFDTGAGW